MIPALRQEFAARARTWDRRKSLVLLPAPIQDTAIAAVPGPRRLPTWPELLLIVLATIALIAALNLYMMTRIVSFLEAQMLAVAASRMSSTP